ncbi:MAG: ABC transporter substrate-binding protein, partial [Candidatus Diapherotrites archaeon]
HFFLLSLLKQEGLTSKDIEPVLLDPDKAATAFLAGEVDAAVTYEPWLSTARNASNGHVLIDSKEAPGLIVDIVVANNDFIKENPEATRAFVKSWFEALDYIEQNPDESEKIMADAFDLGLEEFREMHSGLKRPDLQEHKEFFGSTDNQGPIFKLLNDAGNIWVQEGIIENKADSSGLVDASFINSLN